MWAGRAAVEELIICDDVEGDVEGGIGGFWKANEDTKVDFGAGAFNNGEGEGVGEGDESFGGIDCDEEGRSVEWGRRLWTWGRGGGREWG
jgi:hypothetical protein